MADTVFASSHSEYDAAIKRAEQGTPTVIYIKAESSPVCRATSPKVDKMADDYPSVAFHKMELDASTSSMMKFGIQNTPIFVVMKGYQASTILGPNVLELEQAIKTFASC